MIWTFRPDVFDGQSVPAECLPTLTVKRARRRGPRGRPTIGANSRWTVELRLEPEVVIERTVFDDRADAMDRGEVLARRFSADDLDWQEAYQVPRDRYIDLLSELLPVESGETRDFSSRQEYER